MFIIEILILMSTSSAESPLDFAKPSRDGNRFANPPSFKNWTGVPTFWNIIKWRVSETDHSNIPDEKKILDETIPVHSITEFESKNKSSMFATWLGHATVLVDMEGIRFITDPVWSKRASFFQWFGPKRYRPPPMKIENLPKLHFGVISHDHYDHLDSDAVVRINELNPSMRWFVPLGMQEWMESIGIQNSPLNPKKVTELEWGENESFHTEGKDVTVWCVPAQHWGQRGVFDRNKRLWSGWAVMTPNRRFYYTGDTGFCEDEFRKVGKHFGPFDLAAIPIGAYAPRWFMRSQHIDPHEAVAVHELVRSKFSLGIHWGTYHMGSYEYYLEPKNVLKDIMKNRTDLPPFLTLEMGRIWEEGESEEETTSS
ncbi:unnamed protein product [Cylicocyclus nassatus]|uniref:N-acetylphosphatidylethanolamine-hydrolyzing phospholipase D n=1 Tax=Cylicocyclus nassatus TaxID=53992 RepID=A0AA36GYE9_CYLNA|nr:unnamed protein product [Cylicocyclus nassatus]CAJ0600643.1 unnamed protein product [Cylicocyclus nassatus]